MKPTAFLLLIVAGCSAKQSDATPKSERAAIEARGREVLQALAARDGAKLAPLVHPTKGVRFSPYAYVHTDSDVVLTRAQVATAWTDTTKRLWGHSDGSDAPLLFTFEDYAGRYVYNTAYLAAPKVAYDSLPLHSGNTPSNLAAAYPGTRHIEYHFPEIDPKYKGMDWQSLWLVFDRAGDEWYLVGVVHGMWTI